MVIRDLVPTSKEALTPAEFSALSDIPPELEWLANITNPKTRRAYKVDVTEFLAFSGLREIKSLGAELRLPITVPNLAHALFIAFLLTIRGEER